MKPEPAPIRFKLNGAPISVDAPANRRLSHALRENLDQRGVKVGCDAGDCGACTVLLNGEPICSCLTALGAGERRARSKRSKASAIRWPRS